MMARAKSTLITPATCRTILGLRRKQSLLGTTSIYWGRTGNVILIVPFRLEVGPTSVRFSRKQDGKWRALRADELPKLERRFQRILKEELAEYLQPPQTFAPLQANGEAAAELLSLIVAHVPKPLQNRAHRALRLALDNPAAWLQKYGRQRGLRRPTQNMHVLAVLDAAIGAQMGAELDHRSAPQEFASALQTIARRLRVQVTPPTQCRIAAAIREVQRELLRQGWDLIVVDIESDSYPLLVVEAAHSRHAHTLMKKIGMRIARV